MITIIVCLLFNILIIQCFSTYTDQECNDMKKIDFTKNYLLTIIKDNSSALQCVNNKFKDDYDFILDVVTNNGIALQFVNNTLKSEYYIQLAAVTNNGLALQFINDEFLDDAFFDDAFFKDASFHDNFLNSTFFNEEFFYYQPLNGIFKDYIGIVLAATNQNNNAFKFAHNKLKKHCYLGDDKKIYLNSHQKN